MVRSWVKVPLRGSRVSSQVPRLALAIDVVAWSRACGRVFVYFDAAIDCSASCVEVFDTRRRSENGRHICESERYFINCYVRGASRLKL